MLTIRAFACLLLIPLIGAAVHYRRGRFALASLWNASLPVLVLVASAVAMVANPTPITPGGLLFVIPPAAGLAASVTAYKLRTRHALLFWFPWGVNLLILAFLFYLAFWFHIF